MLAVEEATEQSCPSSDRRTHAGVAGNRPDQCTAGSATGPPSQRALLRLAHPCTPTQGDESDDDKSRYDTSHGCSLYANAVSPDAVFAWLSLARRHA